MHKVSTDSVVVVGLGYVGLPLCSTLSQAGVRVVGIDRDREKVALISGGRSPISDMSSKQIREMLAAGFKVESDFSSVERADTVVLSLPTPLNELGQPDLTALLSGVHSIAPFLNNQILVVLESTVAPCTTDGIVLPRLEESGKVLGEDFLLGYSPERVDPGASRELKTIPKIVSGVNELSGRKAKAFYESVGFQVVEADNTRDAEAAKLLENTYRAVNIALINELAQASVALRVNIDESIRLASTKPFGFTPFYPSAGVGGHCIPIDPVYLKASIEQSGGQSELIGKTLERNRQTPRIVADRIAAVAREHLSSNPTGRIILLGMTYKPDVNDFREAPGPEIANALHELGFPVAYHDPFLSQKLTQTHSSAIWLDDNFKIGPDDVVVLLQKHKEYRELELDFLPPHQRICAGIATGPWTGLWNPSIPGRRSRRTDGETADKQGS